MDIFENKGYTDTICHSKCGDGKGERQMTFIPKPHEIYKHFKGNLYQVVTIAKHSETGELLVIYQALYGDFATYARPLAMFTSEVDKKKYPEVRQQFRFELQGADADRQERESGSIDASKQSNESGNIDASKQSNESGSIDASKQSNESGNIDASKQSNESESADANSQAREGTAKSPVDTMIAADEELTLDPLVLEFLDADSYEQKLNILAGLHHRITNEMITTMAISCDIEVNDGEPEERYEELKNCLLTMEKFECNRLR